MLVPRSFTYHAASNAPKEMYDEKSETRRLSTTEQRRLSVKTKAHAHEMPHATSPPISTQPVEAPSPHPKRQQASEPPRSLPTMHNAPPRRKQRMPSSHNPNAVSPSVQALLAVTQIPRPKPHQMRRKPAMSRSLSIDELVGQWKSEQIHNPSYGSSSALSMLLEEDQDVHEPTSFPGSQEEHFAHSRSTSADSLPSLDNDDRSVLSLNGPPTPDFLRTRRSMSNFKKEKSRSLPAAEDCDCNHPLVTTVDDEEPDDTFIISTTPIHRESTTKPKSRFTSNITTSLQALKNAAITTISSLNLSNASTPSQRSPSSPLSDEVLWSHPFLFPRFSPEVRPPTTQGTPTEAQRRYLNPLPLTFEEQEAPFQQALHAPFLAERIKSAPSIQMQTYNRGRRKVAPAKRSGTADPQSEIGRALAGPTGVRQREPRENGEFLRMVVLEMNMRRAGKLANGRAKMWLAPRQDGMSGDVAVEGVPRRWVAVNAY